ncbi:hypothetical protein ACWCYL_27855 [Streptomyces sp. 900105755]
MTTIGAAIISTAHTIGSADPTHTPDTSPRLRLPPTSWRMRR